MDDQAIREWYERFQRGEIQAMELGQRILKTAISSDGNITPDLDRAQRTGYPEVVYGQGKSTESIQRVTERLLESSQEVLITRIMPEQVRVLSERFPWCRWNHVARTLRVGRSAIPVEPAAVVSDRRVAVVTAGTTDEAVAQEA